MTVVGPLRNIIKGTIYNSGIFDFAKIQIRKKGIQFYDWYKFTKNLTHHSLLFHLTDINTWKWIWNSLFDISFNTRDINWKASGEGRYVLFYKTIINT